MAKAIVQNFLILLCFISFYDFLFVHHINIGIAPKVNISNRILSWAVF